MNITKTAKSIGIEYKSFDIRGTCGSTLRLRDAMLWYKKDVVLKTMRHYGWLAEDAVLSDAEIGEAMLTLANSAVAPRGYTVNSQYYPITY